jgi:hypothetical protein
MRPQNASSRSNKVEPVHTKDSERRGADESTSTNESARGTVTWAARFLKFFS